MFYRVDDDYSIKVADFGLTRDIYATEYYKSIKLTKLPVKWMSLESLLDNFFNEKTDVVCIMSIQLHLMVKVIAKYITALIIMQSQQNISTLNEFNYAL